MCCQIEEVVFLIYRGFFSICSAFLFWLCCEHLQRVCCQIEEVVFLICRYFFDLQRVELSRPPYISLTICSSEWQGFFIAGTAPYFSIKGCANPALNWALFIKRSSTNTLVKLHCCPKKHASTVHITLGYFGKLNKVIFFLQPQTNFSRDILPEQCIWMKRVDVLLLLSLWSMCARAFSSGRNAHIRSSTLVYVSKSHDWKNFLKLVRSRE